MRGLNISVRTLLIGLALAAGVFIGIRYVFSPIWNITVRTVIVLTGAVLGTLAGGYYASRQGGYQDILHAVLIALLDVGILVLLRLLPVNLPLIGGMLLAAVAGVFIARRMPISAAGTPFAAGRYLSPSRYPSSAGYGTPRQSFQLRLPAWAWKIWSPVRRFFSNRRAEQLYGQLLRRTRMDRDLADRLIEFEHRRNPYAGRETLIRNALERLERDNR